MERKQALVRIAELAEELSELQRQHLDQHRTYERKRLLEDISEEVTDELMTGDFAVGNMLYDNMDWPLLRTQKDWLINIGGSMADGLICLLDVIQDQAVVAGVPESVVFGNFSR